MCGLCAASTTVTGTITDCITGNPLGNVEVFDGGNLLRSLTETDVTGNFQRGSRCPTDLTLYFSKYGYTSVQEFYTYSGSNLLIKMCKNCRFIYVALSCL